VLDLASLRLVIVAIVTSQTLCVAKQDYVVLLDENGKASSSEGMAKLVAEVLCSLAHVNLMTKGNLVT